MLIHEKLTKLNLM